MTNTQGAELGPGGFVICRKCGMETSEISRESPPEYAFCMRDRPRSAPPNSVNHQEDTMPAVPKPGHKEKEPKMKKEKKEKKAKKEKAPKVKRAKAGSLIEWVRSCPTKPTRDEVIEECLRRGWPRKRGTDCAWHADKAGLLSKRESAAA